jgi:hypothetical protein
MSLPSAGPRSSPERRAQLRRRVELLNRRVPFVNFGAAASQGNQGDPPVGGSVNPIGFPNLTPPMNVKDYAELERNVEYLEQFMGQTSRNSTTDSSWTQTSPVWRGIGIPAITTRSEPQQYADLEHRVEEVEKRFPFIGMSGVQEGGGITPGLPNCGLTFTPNAQVPTQVTVVSSIAQTVTFSAKYVAPTDPCFTGTPTIYPSTVVFTPNVPVTLYIVVTPSSSCTASSKCSVEIDASTSKGCQTKFVIKNISPWKCTACAGWAKLSNGSPDNSTNTIQAWGWLFLPYSGCGEAAVSVPSWPAYSWLYGTYCWEPSQGCPDNWTLDNINSPCFGMTPQGNVQSYGRACISCVSGSIQVYWREAYDPHSEPLSFVSSVGFMAPPYQVIPGPFWANKWAGWEIINGVINWNWRPWG